MNACRRCGGEVVQKNCMKLLVVGAAMLAAAGLLQFWPSLWAPAMILLVTGVYVALWAVFGHGRWCRGCKRFDGV